MPESWMKRSNERQEIQEQTHRDIFQLDTEDEEWGNNSDQACLYLGQVIIGYLFGFDVPISSSFFSRAQYEHAAHVMFDNKIFPLYTKFSRIEEEKRAMLAELASWLTQHALNHFCIELASKEILDPEVFDKPASI